MPIRPENKSRYPVDWLQIREAILKRAAYHCEGSPAYPHCRAEHQSIHPETGGYVVLTIAHLADPIEDCRPENLRAWCQRCHNTYDAKKRADGIRERREQAAGQLGMELV